MRAMRVRGVGEREREAAEEAHKKGDDGRLTILTADLLQC